VQHLSAVVAKARSAVQVDDTLRSSELDDHEKAPQYVAELHHYLNVTAPPPAVCKRIAVRRISTVDATSSSTAIYFRQTQTRSQLCQQQQQLLRRQQQQQQLLQCQWARMDPNGDIEDDGDDDDDDDAEDEDVDDVFVTPLLPPTPPSAARPAAKKFKSAASVAAAVAGSKKKKKSPSIIKKYSSDRSELAATTTVAAGKTKAAR